MLVRKVGGRYTYIIQYGIHLRCTKICDIHAGSRLLVRVYAVPCRHWAGSEMLIVALTTKENPAKWIGRFAESVQGDRPGSYK